MTFDFVIHGAPRTKKNHGRRKYSFRLRRTLNVPSEAYEKWEGEVGLQVLKIRRRAEMLGVELPIEQRVNCRALIYRDADRGDAVGYYQAIADGLQKHGIVFDDVQIVSWDGSRLMKDSARPRVEIVLEGVGE